MARTTSSVICSLMLGGALLIGCDKNDTKPADNTTSGGSGSMSSGGGAMSSGSGTMSGDSSRMGATTRPSGDMMRDVAPTTMPSSSAMTSEATQAQEWLDKARQYVMDNKFELAEEALNKVDAMKAQLPPALQTQLASARSMLQAAKAKNSVTSEASKLGIPGVGGNTNDANK